jgi:hypothetical protein
MNFVAGFAPLGGTPQSSLEFSNLCLEEIQANIQPNNPKQKAELQNLQN